MNASRLFYGTVAMITTVGATLFALMLMLGAETFAKQPVWRKCPLPPNSQPIPWEMQHSAWSEAKKLSGFEEVQRWTRPCQAVRVFNHFVGDPDGKGALPEGTYQGFHDPPEAAIFARTGEVLACEYIFIFLPQDASALEVEHTLVHEYLHAIFYRVYNLSEQFREEFTVEDTELWVRLRMNDTRWLEVYGYFDKEKSDGE